MKQSSSRDRDSQSSREKINKKTYKQNREMHEIPKTITRQKMQENEIDYTY